MTDEQRDDVAIARALRRLDALVEEHPELRGPCGPDNVTAWITTLEQHEGDTMPTEIEETVQVAFRFSKHLLKRIDQHCKRMGEESAKAGRKLAFTRADAVRALLERTLDEVEKSDKRRGASK